MVNSNETNIYSDNNINVDYNFDDINVETSEEFNNTNPIEAIKDFNETRNS